MPVGLHSPLHGPGFGAQLVLFHSLILNEAAFSRKNSNAHSFKHSLSDFVGCPYFDPRIRGSGAVRPPHNAATFDLALDSTELQ